MRRHYSMLPLSSMWSRYKFIMRTVIFAVLVTTCLCLDEECPNRDAEVLILGAGMSGVSAASNLHGHGVHDFIIIEAMDRIGGRIQSETIDGVVVELGAGWIQDAETSGDGYLNPLMDLANTCGLKGNVTDWDSISVYNESGDDITDSPKLRWEDFFAAIDQAGSISLRRQRKGESDLSTREALNASGWYPQTSEDNIVEWYYFDSEFSYPPEESSLFNNLPDQSLTDFGDSYYMVSDQRGYRYLVECLADTFLRTNDPRLHLNALVTNIKWNSDCVCVTVIEQGRTMSYCGSYGIVTFGIGVLQSDNARKLFNPPLPDWKLDTINTFRMAIYLKIFLKFNETFWRNDKELFLYADNRRGYFPYFHALANEFLNRDTNTLMLIITEDEALRIASQSEDITKSEIMQILRTIFGPTIPDPSHIVIPDFIGNPLFMGMWSDISLGGNNTIIEVLGRPVGRLYFSGEATNLQYRATVHGAYLAGIDTTNMILEQRSASRCSLISPFVSVIVLCNHMVERLLM